MMETFRAGDIEKDSDHPLVTAAKRGDTPAFEKLVLRHRRKVFAVALRIIKNREDAEDVVQESFHRPSSMSAAFKKSHSSQPG